MRCQTKTKVNNQRARKNHDWLGFTSNRQQIGARFFFFGYLQSHKEQQQRKAKLTLHPQLLKHFFCVQTKQIQVSLNPSQDFTARVRA